MGLFYIWNVPPTQEKNENNLVNELTAILPVLDGQYYVFYILKMDRETKKKFWQFPKEALRLIKINQCVTAILSELLQILKVFVKVHMQ